MKLKSIVVLSFALFSVGCKQNKNDKSASLSEKKSLLEKLQTEKNGIEDQITKLQREIAQLDTTAAAKIKLVSTEQVLLQKFEHFIDLQGKVDAENISYIAPSGMGGLVKAVYVKQGQLVKKGQLLLKLDDKIYQQQVVAARQQLNQLKTQLNYAKNICDRQKNLWNQGIGTEVQLLNAQTQVQALEDQLKTATEQVQVAVVQANTTNIFSDVDGVADVVNIKVGETFIGNTPMGPQIKIVNSNLLKIVSGIPENYISRVLKGTPVVVEVSDAQQKINSVISLVSQSIEPSVRGFIAEAKIPASPLLKPNQSAVMHIKDYEVEKALVIPVNVIQSDETGKYVYIVEVINNKKVAKRRTIKLGEIYADKAEVKLGLTEGDQLVTEGYQNLYDGQQIGTL